MEDKVFNAVMLATPTPTDKKNLFIVWSCYILGNRKFLVGDINSKLYFEVTYCYTRNEWYVDVYNKINNRKIHNDQLEEYTTINSSNCNNN